MFKRKFWKRGDKLTVKELNRLEAGVQTFNGVLENTNFNDITTLKTGVDLNNLGNKNLIVTLSKNNTYENAPAELTSASALLIQLYYTTSTGTNSIFQFLVIGGGSIYTRLRLISTWGSWTQITAVPQQVEG